MHTNETQYYELPQYVGSDIINPLVDTNGAYQKIDTALHEIAAAESNDASKIATLEQTVGNNSNGLVKDVADLQAQNGDTVLNTTAQNLSGAINEVNNKITDAQTDIGSVSGRVTSIENILPNKVDTSILNGTYQFIGLFEVRVEADGTKTYGDMLNEVRTAITNHLSNGNYLTPYMASLVGRCGFSVHSGRLISATYADISGIGLEAGNLTELIVFDSSSVKEWALAPNTGTITLVDLTNVIATNAFLFRGMEYKLLT